MGVWDCGGGCVRMWVCGDVGRDVGVDVWGCGCVGMWVEMWGWMCGDVGVWGCERGIGRLTTIG